MTAPPEVKSAVQLATQTLDEGVEHLSKRKLAKLALALAAAVIDVWEWSGGE